MKVSKAIEILQEKQQENEPHWERGDRDAINLGIEALKRLNELRTPSSGNPHLQLPGETEEET